MDQPLSLPPPVAGHGVGQISVDGNWRWTGDRWALRFGGHRSVRTRSRWAVGLLVAWAIAAVVALVADVGRLSLIDRFQSGNAPSPGELDASDTFVRSSSLLWLALFVAAAVVFLLWLHRVVANSHALGATLLRFTPGWAVGWWFIPVMNLVRGEQIVEEAWRASDPSFGGSAPDRRQALRAPILVRTWWALWLLSSILSVASSSGSTRTVAGLRDNARANLVSQPVHIVAAVLLVGIILAVTSRQERKASALRPPPPPPPPT